jgi:hypothetical protein
MVARSVHVSSVTMLADAAQGGCSLVTLASVALSISDTGFRFTSSLGMTV